MKVIDQSFLLPLPLLQLDSLLDFIFSFKFLSSSLVIIFLFLYRKQSYYCLIFCSQELSACHSDNVNVSFVGRPNSLLPYKT